MVSALDNILPEPYAQLHHPRLLVREGRGEGRGGDDYGQLRLSKGVALEQRDLVPVLLPNSY